VTQRLYRNARIYTPVDRGEACGGDHQGRLRVLQRGGMLVENGRIQRVGEEAEVVGALPADSGLETVDCEGACLVPGFVDPHTHMCFARRREEEFARRIAGTPYLEILRQGGGILSSVKAVREADEDALYRNTEAHALSALQHGTTTLEIKSGYGLDTATELKMLRVIGRLAQESPLDVVPTFMGAHAVPASLRDDPEAYVDLVVKEMLPAVRSQGIARFCDVFCEEGVFSIGQTRRILASAAALGLGIKLHADEVHDLGGAGLAADLGAISADHLLAAGEENLERMAARGVVANLLPATAYSLRKPFAPARRMVAAGLPVALATDCNPGSSYTESMPFVIGLAVMNMDLTPAEALTAATLNGAYALGMEQAVGSLDPGKQADFMLLDGETPAILAYHAGVSPVKAVYKHGEMVA